MRLIALFISATALYAAQPEIESVGIGLIYKNEDKSLDISYQNNDNEIVVGDVRSSCDCLRLLAAPGVIAANEVKILPFSYRSGNLGKVSVDIEVLNGQSRDILRQYVVSGYVAERDWLVSAKEVLQLRESDCVVVDIRSPQAYARVHIPKALNVAAFALRARTDFRDRKLILIDDGITPDQSLELVRQLRGKGFSKICMMDGGLSAWVANGGKVEGTFVSVDKIVRLSPDDFLRAHAVVQCRVFELVENDDGKPFAWPFAVQQYSKTSELVEGLRALSARSTAAALVIMPAAVSLEKIEAARDRNSSVRVYYAEGGSQALRALVSQQKAIGAGAQEVTMAKPVNRSVRGSGTGCGSCNKR